MLNNNLKNLNIKEMTVAELKTFIDSHKEGDYLLVDVREPEEYGKEHIPGAKLIPLMDIENGKIQLELAEHTIFYCRSGNRSRRSAQYFARHAGNKTIYNLTGGITAWQGKTLFDLPQIHVFKKAQTLADLLKRAIDLEKGADRFYGVLLNKLRGTSLEKLITSLAEAEEGHARALYAVLSRVSAESLPPFETFYEQLEGLVLESGEPLVKYTAWLTNGTIDLDTVLEVALDLELKAYDLYRNLAEQAEKETMQKQFLDLADQEKRHVQLVLKVIGQQARA